MKLCSVLLLIAASALIACRADDPPLEGAPLMTGTNIPHRVHPISARPSRVTPSTVAAKPESEGPATNAPPQTLQSVEASKAAPVPMPPPKGPGIVIYGAYGFKVGNEAFWVIPDRYLSDLTNHYQFQFAHKIVLPEP